MSLFDGKDLFGSGRHVFEISGLSLRHALAEVPGGRGVQISSQGHSGRLITVKGELLGDSVEDIRLRWEAMESCLDGKACTLVDDRGSQWQQVVMLSFEPSVVERVGARWRCGYKLMFVQVQP